MSEVRIVDADGRRLERWDEDVERSVNGTIFHRRRFLAYHGDRFRDTERLLVVLDGDDVLAQVPVVIDGGILRSPYGGSYGSFAFQRYPTYAQASAVTNAFVDWMRAEGVQEATLTPPIAACSDQPLDVLHFALLEAGFVSINRDVSSVLQLGATVLDSVTSRARNTARKAERSGVEVVAGARIEDFLAVLDSTFDRHGVQPTHTHDELTWLGEHLREGVRFDVAYHEGEPVAGVAYFAINRLVDSSFYFCQRPERRELNGLTLCVLRGLERAREAGFAWFDFGTSTASMQPRENVFRFKEQFSPIGQFRETFRWALA